MDGKILFVDDEEYILYSFQRQFFDVFDLDVAQSAKEALSLMQNGNHYKVIISDMRMPQMNGIDFLIEAQKISPMSVRVMLTGNVDIDTAIGAVNQGEVFKFLLKPCDEETLKKVIYDCLKQYNLEQAEKELLEKTLKGSIKVLMDLLALSAPKIYSRSQKIRQIAAKIMRKVKGIKQWRIDLATLLSQIGWISIPPEKRETMEDDQDVYEIAASLVNKIPRLEKVAQIIEQLNHHPTPWNSFNNQNEDYQIQLETQILRVSIDLEKYLHQGLSFQDSVQKILDQIENLHPLLKVVLNQIDVTDTVKKAQYVPIDRLKKGMIIAEDIQHLKTKLLLVAKNQEVNEIVIKFLMNHYQEQNIRYKLLVYI